MKKRRDLFKVFLMMLVATSFLLTTGCQRECSSGGGSNNNDQVATIIVSFFSGSSRIKTTGVKVELVEEATRGVIDSAVSNNEDRITFVEKPDRTVRAFVRATLPNSRVIEGPSFDYYKGLTCERSVNL